MYNNTQLDTYLVEKADSDDLTFSYISLQSHPTVLPRHCIGNLITIIRSFLLFLKVVSWHVTDEAGVWGKVRMILRSLSLSLPGWWFTLGVWSLYSGACTARL